MEDYTLTVKAIAVNMGLTIGNLADVCGIERNHLYEVSAGRAKMTADDILRIAKAAGIEPKNVATGTK